MSQNQSQNEDYRLQPTHGKAIRFVGRQLASASGRWVGGRDQSRWTNLTLYVTQAGKYVLDIEYNTQWQGEQGSRAVTVCPDAAAVVDRLTDDLGELGRLDTELLAEAAEIDAAFEAAATIEIE